MKNPLHSESPLAGMEERIERALTAIDHGTRRPETEDSARTQLLSVLHPTQRVRLSEQRRRLAAAAVAVLTPMALIGVAAAFHGSGGGATDYFSTGQTATATVSATHSASDPPSTNSDRRNAPINSPGCDASGFAPVNSLFGIQRGRLACIGGANSDFLRSGPATPGTTATPSSTAPGTPAAEAANSPVPGIATATGGSPSAGQTPGAMGATQGEAKPPARPGHDKKDR